MLEQPSTIQPNELSEKIIQGLQEYDEAELIRELVAFLGVDKTLGFYQQALTIESTGGMMTARGYRRRTPGGVFFSLVKNNLPDIERELLFPSGKLAFPEPYILEQIQRFSLMQLEIGVKRIERALSELQAWDEARRTQIQRIKQQVNFSITFLSS